MTDIVHVVRLSDLQQKTPDNRTWCDGVVARWADGDLQSRRNELDENENLPVYSFEET